MDKNKLSSKKNYFLKETENFYFKFTQKRVSFLDKNKFFYNEISKCLKKVISNKKSILFYCCGNYPIAKKIEAENILIEEINKEIFINNEYNSEINVNEINLKNFETFVIADIEHQKDPHNNLKKLSEQIKDGAEIIIISKSLIWSLIIKIFKIFFKNQFSTTYNFLPYHYLKNLIEINNFEIIKNEKKIIFPKKIWIISDFLNTLFCLPILNFFCMINLTVIKKKKITKKKLSESRISVIIPCKDEEKNIKMIGEKIINLGQETEYIFGNDKSQDDTIGEIKKISPKNSKIKIKFYEGPGICKSKNVYKGIDESSGDIILIYDADCTVSFEDVKNSLTVLTETNSDFINCTRMIYPQENKAMKKLNFVGNICFAFLFSYLFNQKITDTLCGTKIFYKTDWIKLKNSFSLSGIEDLWGDYDLLIGAYRNNLKISEVPVKYYNRIEGETKMKSVFRNGLRMLSIIFKSFTKLRLN